MKRILVSLSVFTTGLGLAGCNSGLDTAKEEMTSSCLASAGGQLTEDECNCMTESAFASLDDEERDLMGRISSTDKNISESDLADELGMDMGEMRTKVRAVQKKVMSNSMSLARECVG